MQDVLGIFNRMREMFIRYMNSPFALAQEELAAERDALLRKAGTIYQYPYIEAMPQYESSERKLSEVCADIGWSEDFGDFASNGLFHPNHNLHLHQFNAFREVLNEKKNIVVTSGTGSGKTESFLLPLIATILNEGEKWGATQSEQQVSNSDIFRSNRENETRSAAIRGLLLYPLNALVEDQLVRLRKALDSDAAREWLNKHRKGNRIYFGRYTGKTPISGKRSDANKKDQLRKTLKTMRKKQEKLRERFADLRIRVERQPDHDLCEQLKVELQDSLPNEWFRETSWSSEQILIIQKELDQKLNDKLAFLSQVGGAEMISRWEMQDYPPDLFITNFSMLNIMLTRQIEQCIFEKTKKWLEEDSSNTFFLVLDELHAYRGTTGTEVAYVIRTLLHRIGLTPDSPQLRVLATSASIDQNSVGFLEEFFGIPIENFKIIDGKRTGAEKYQENKLYFDKADDFGSFYNSLNEHPENDEFAIQRLCAQLGFPGPHGDPYRVLAKALDASGAVHAFLKSCERPRSILDLSSELFGDREDEQMAIGGLLYAIVLARQGNDVMLPIRAHLFFRNFHGLWACSNPECTEVDPRFQFEGRTVGKLYTQPLMQCNCGSRVLDFYYCQNCGDVFLGGYKTPTYMSDRNCLTADFPNLDALPDKLPSTKIYKEYALYWPGKENSVDEEARTQDRTISPNNRLRRNKLFFSWKKAEFDPIDGGIVIDCYENPTGHMYHIDGEQVDWVDRMPAFPTICPHCGDDWEIHKSEPLDSSKRNRSPIRGQRTGFDMIAQIMIDALMRELPEKDRPKAVLFSDSRQDAAKLSAKIELNHYRTLVRTLLVKAVREQQEPLRAFVKKVKGNATEDELILANSYEFSNWSEAQLITAYLENRNLPPQMKSVAEQLMEQVSKPPRLGMLWDSLERGLLKLGMNPGGPDYLLQQYEKGKKWVSLYNWTNPEEPIRSVEKTDDQNILHEKIMKQMKDHVIANVLFAQRKRDLESTALGMLSVDLDRSFSTALEKEEAFWRQLLDSSVRILGGMKRFDQNRHETERPPRQLKKYWKQVAKRNNVNEERLIARAEAIFESLNGVKQYLIVSDQLHVIPYETDSLVYVCSRCQRIHLHPSCGVCTDCYGLLQERRLNPKEVNDYYRYLSYSSNSLRRFHSEEMTGQTDTEKSSKRQQLFQGIYEDGDIPLVDEVDILSVTTTMEAGVDIGSLRIVAMSNMPPQRFNYQQRIGRCGRRGAALSVGLTLCRGRSHDNWYFSHLDKMTGDPSPQPYIDLGSRKICQRVLVKEVLFSVIQETGLSESLSESSNVHGEFGGKSEWHKIKNTIETYLLSPQGSSIVQDHIDVLTVGTKLSDVDKEKMYKYVTGGELIDRITEISEDDRFSQGALSEALATAGLLPMFGFPTRVRSLHHEIRKKGMPVRELSSGTIDRDLEIAISEYAPGAELVKDKMKIRAVGVAHYWMTGNQVFAESNPLGPQNRILLCNNCQILIDQNVEDYDRCTSCGASKNEPDSPFREITLSEPQGFRSDWRPHNFTEEFEWTSRSSVPRLADDSGTLDTGLFRNTRFRKQDGHVYTINDNGGKLFVFRKLFNDFEGWIEESYAERYHNFAKDFDPVKTALASIKNTEILVLEPEIIKQGITFDPKRLGVRAGLLSFAFLFRRIATNLLDVDSNELQVGLRPVLRDTGELVGQIFVSDTLINGAGYAQYIGQDKVLGHILSDLSGNLENFPALRTHNCDSSCYECLRTYENMGYHGLLDWRLALDVSQLLFDANFDPKIDEKWAPVVEKSLRSLAKHHNGEKTILESIPALIFPEIETAIIFGHPFWETEGEHVHPAYTSAEDQANEQGLHNVFRHNIFDLIRRPNWIIAEVMKQMQ